MTNETEVLIIGGSLNGLTTALLLANFGVRCMVIERHPEATVQYKFAGISPRSMEIYRSVGIEEEIRAKRTGDQKSGEIVRGKNLADPELQFQGKAWAATPDLSAASAETCDQERLEPILRAHAERLGADARFNTELFGFEQDDDEVRARIRNRETGEENVISASYLVAADGVAGKTREKLGIGRHGPGILQHWMNIIFDTDLEPYLQGRLFTSCFVTDINGTFTPREKRWLMALQYQPERGDKPEDFDRTRTAELIRNGAGRDDVKAELFDARSWEVGAYRADRFREGRAFLVGDAAHSMPPTGGFGGNTGIHDCHNLAWKLAYVLQGKADPELLDTYDSERRPVAEATLAQALARLSLWFKDEGKQLPPPVPIIDDWAVYFGHVYPTGAFISEEGPPEQAFEDPRRPSGRAGTRAPHVTIEAADVQIPIHDYTGAQAPSHGEFAEAHLAIHDCWGKGFALLTGSDGRTWREAAASVSRDVGIDLRCIRVGRDAESEAQFHVAYGVDADGAVLVRPDGFIAWRSRGTVADAKAALRGVLKDLSLKLQARRDDGSAAETEAAHAA